MRYRTALRPADHSTPPNPVTRNLPLVPSSQTPSGLKSAGERNVPLPPPVLNGESAFPLAGTERGTGGEDRNGEGESLACTGRAVPDRFHARAHATLVYLIVFDAASHVTALRRK